ncbi:AsmA-like protein [Candidatus Pelagibacter ubique]|uniref:AsmA-like protein n=1 Tax=Pelagibacter ubique TaxID=198252 RepID=A0ABX1T3X6_PELUQ|nr:AsmA-like C-terminal region-containing protein [Candidatus Pelagibacter ubique]NMN67743.1 AsmA-like protein [Candidatus Pelagibacter ubique]
MIKKIIKILSVIILILLLVILYLSIFGIKTDKFNNQIVKQILKKNEKINLNIKDVKYSLNPYSFKVIIETKNPQLSLDGRNFEIKNIQTNIALKSLIKGQFLVDHLHLKTKEIKINDAIALGRVLKNTTELFVLNKIIKDGSIAANVILNFDEEGKIKENYEIEGYIKKAKLSVLNQFKLQNLNFNFYINKNIYSLKKVEMKLNDIKIISPIIEIQEKKNGFFVNGKFLNEEKNFDIKKLKPFFSILSADIDIKKIIFSSNNNFSFNISKKLKFDNLKVQSTVTLKQLVFNEKKLKLNRFFPSYVNEVELTDHKIDINYQKEKFNIKGNGNILLEKKLDNLSYEMKKDKSNFFFNSKIFLKNNSLQIDFLDYEKKEGSNSLLLIKGNFKKNNQLNFDQISLKENNNEILIKNLMLNENFKIIDIENFSINYKNEKKIINNLVLKKNESNFIIEGESFDASRMINDILDSDNDTLFIFENLNSKITVKIDKTYIDEVNYLNGLNGNMVYDNNKVNNLILESTFPNKKKISLSIKTNNKAEIVTSLFSSYPKPLVERYDFIKGFEEGKLNFYSTKKGNKSNSVLTIENFKVQEVPVLAKLLSLASLQGIADLLTGEGIRFNNFEMNFSNQNNLTTIEEVYAIGPAVSILIDGYIQKKNLISLRGTLVPATTINRTIAAIPLLGKILVGDKSGEGVFGVSFKIKGSPKDLKTSVNPIKTLTPRFITRTLEKIKKN